jgi:hypothetical protein
MRLEQELCTAVPTRTHGEQTFDPQPILLDLLPS